MMLINNLRRNPFCIDLSAPNKQFDTRPLIPPDIQCFDISEIEAQLVLKRTVTKDANGDDADIECIYTPRGLDMLQGIFHDDAQQAPLFGIVPPYDYSWFEYPIKIEGYLSTGIALMDVTEIFKACSGGAVDELKAKGVQHVMRAEFINLYTMKGQTYAVREGFAQIATDEDGMLVAYTNESTAPNNSVPQNASLATLLVSLMLLNHGMVRAQNIPSPPISRQQRRCAARHNTTPSVPVQFHKLTINCGQETGSGGTHEKGGWEVAWHRVRGHLRHLRSGKVVSVRPHTKGNPLKGIILKHYNLTYVEKGAS